MIHEGMTVILDSGSTTMLIAEGLMTAKKYHGDYQQSPGCVCPFRK